MAQIRIDEISVDELYALKKEIDSCINTQNTVETPYCEEASEYQELEEGCQEKARVMKQRVRSLAIALEIHGEGRAAGKCGIEYHTKEEN